MSLFAPSDPFEPPSLLALFLISPPKFILRFLYRTILFLRPAPGVVSTNAIRVVCISDTHSKIPAEIPDGDLLVHAGDLTNSGTSADIQAQIDWLNSLPHTHKVAISGNHDAWLDSRSRSTLNPPDRGDLRWGKVHYLQHSSATLDFPTRRNRKLRVYGAPQTPTFGEPNASQPAPAFPYPKGEDAWTSTVPSNTDILVTHTPPMHHMDLNGLGCEFLLKELWRTKPPLHIFGHVHAGRGQEVAYWDETQQAFERGCKRKDGLIRSTLNILLWIDVLRVASYGLSSIIWERVWGGEGRSSWLVNSSVMYINTGRLDNPPQVVDI